MRRLRRAAVALVLALFAGEAGAQYYPYSPYPQQNQYYPAYPSYGPQSYYSPPPQAYYSPAPSVQNQYYPSMLPPVYQQTAPPIFSQSNLARPAQKPAPPVIPPALPSLNAGDLPPGPSAPPQVILTPPNAPAIPRSLPTGPKTSPAPEKETAKQEVAEPKQPEKIVAPKIGLDADDDDENGNDSGAPAKPPAASEPLAPPATNSFTDQPVLDRPRAGPRLWANIEYLLWFVRPGPVAVPLVTRNPLTNTPAGVIASLGEPGTEIIFGAGSGHSINYDGFNGGRWTIGGWIDPDNTFGAEVTGFTLERRTNIFTAGSAGGNAPVVSIPFFATEPFGLNPAGETSLNAGGAANVISVNSASHLWGIEINGALNLSNSSSFRLAALAGLRYLNLTESLTLSDVFFDPTTAGIVDVRDGFDCQNHFYGGQIGLKGGTTMGRFTIDSLIKVAFGDNSQTLSVGGQSRVTNGAFGLTGSQAGVFAQGSNMGRFHHDEFTVVPEFQLQFGYLLTANVRPFIAYNLLYFPRAIRPGNQLDRNINPTEQPTFGGTGGVITGFATPLPAMHNSDFWAQGLNVGVEVRY